MTNLRDSSKTKKQYNTIIICMATMARSLWLAAKWARFSCNDQALLARCPRHIQSVFNLIVDILMDIRVMVNWQLSSWPVSHNCIVGSSVRSGVFFWTYSWGDVGCDSVSHSTAWPQSERKTDYSQRTGQKRTKEPPILSFHFQQVSAAQRFKENDWRKRLTPDVSFWG